MIAAYRLSLPLLCLFSSTARAGAGDCEDHGDCFDLLNGRHGQRSFCFILNHYILIDRFFL